MKEENDLKDPVADEVIISWREYKNIIAIREQEEFETISKKIIPEFNEIARKAANLKSKTFKISLTSEAETNVLTNLLNDKEFKITTEKLEANNYSCSITFIEKKLI